MIDLDEAAQELTAAVAHHAPDLPRVERTARRRLRRRRLLTSLAVVLVVGAGALAALAATGGGRGGDGDGEQVHAGPTAKGPDAGPPGAERLVDYGLLRVTVPVGWVSVTTDSYPAGTCEADGLILVGPEVVLPSACIGVPAIEVRSGAEAPEEGPLETRISDDGVALELVDRTPAGDETWSVPSLDAVIETRHGTDPSAVLDTVEAAPRLAARIDTFEANSSGRPLPTEGRKTVAFDGIEVSVPEAWAEVPHEPGGDDDDPCRRWRREGPNAVVGATGNPRCEDERSWVPRDGVWLLPVDQTPVDRDFEANEAITIGGLTMTLIWDVHLDVMEVVVPAAPGGRDVLVRIGLGVDPRTAGSILASIRRTTG